MSKNRSRTGRNARSHNGATVLLTGHYMADVEGLCCRIILIDSGSLTYDGDLAGLAARLAPYKLRKITLSELVHRDWSSFGEPLPEEVGAVCLRVRREAVGARDPRAPALIPVPAPEQSRPECPPPPPRPRRPAPGSR